MLRGGFRHLVVLDEGEVAGILSVRDIVRVWAATQDRRGGMCPPTCCNTTSELQ